MLRLLGRVTALLLCLSATGGAAAAPIDCGRAPSAKCLAAAIFSLAKTLPESNGFRQHVAFAEQELASGDIKIALEYVVWDNPDPSSWEDVEWIARAGRFDRAIEEAKQRKSTVERLGGLLAVAAQMLDRNETARATKIVDEVERELPSIHADDNDQEATSLPREAGEIRARLGQTERAAQLISGTGEAVGTLLAIASKYPVAASLREQAWREAERAKELRGWRQLVEDAISRGDKAEISRTAQRAGKAIGVATDANVPMWAIPLARVLLAAGEPNLSAKLIEPWPQWVNGKDAISQFNTVDALMPVLAGLGREDEVQRAASAVNDVYDRSRCLSVAAEEYFRLGRHDVGAKLDAEALRFAASSPAEQLKQRTDGNTALHNLALARAGHGDIQGALAVVAKLSDGVRVRDVTSYVVRRAIDSGHGPVAGPAIESLQQIAYIVQNVGLLLRAAESWLAIGNEAGARENLSKALEKRDALQAQLTWEESSLAAELMWRLEGAGKAEAMIGIVDKLGVNDPSAIDHLVEVIRPISPAVAVQLSNRQIEGWRRITELANIAIQIADAAR
jgi:tetratricopeptide (TPR) repeat protein